MYTQLQQLAAVMLEELIQLPNAGNMFKISQYVFVIYRTLRGRSCGLVVRELECT